MQHEGLSNDHYSHPLFTLHGTCGFQHERAAVEPVQHAAGIAWSQDAHHQPQMCISDTTAALDTNTALYQQPLRQVSSYILCCTKYYSNLMATNLVLPILCRSANPLSESNLKGVCCMRQGLKCESLMQRQKQCYLYLKHSCAFTAEHVSLGAGICGL